MRCSSIIFILMLWGAFQPAFSQVEFSIVRLPLESKDSMMLSLRSTPFRSIKAVGFEISTNDDNAASLLGALIRAGENVFNFPEKIRVSKTAKSLKVFLIKRRNTPMMYSRGGEILRLTIPNSVSFSGVMKNWNVMVLDSSNNPMPASFSDTILKSETSSPVRYAIRSFPNPVKDHLMIENDVGDVLSISVYDILGRKFQQLMLAPVGVQAQKFRISMGDLTPGVYFVRITRDKEKDQVIKIMKIR